MSFFSKKIKSADRTQILCQGFVLDDMLNKDILKELKEKFSDRGEIVVTDMVFRLLPKEEPDKMKEKEVIGTKKLIIQDMDSVSLGHPSPIHIKDNVVVITSNRNKTLEKFIE